ncbi:uncharacterized protein ISCGN_006964 [Ixodes scapularis]
MSQAHRKNSGIGPFTQKRQRASSTSDSDDSLVSSSELHEAKKKTKYWKARCKELREDNVFLQEQVRALQALLGSKLFRTNGGLAQAPQAVGPVAALSGSCPADITYMADGRLHLQKGIVLTPTQAKRVMAHTKPSLVVKETAKSILTTPGLGVRSMSDQLPPNKRASGEQPRPALTPEKVDVVEDGYVI